MREQLFTSCSTNTHLLEGGISSPSSWGKDPLSLCLDLITLSIIKIRLRSRVAKSKPGSNLTLKGHHFKAVKCSELVLQPYVVIMLMFRDSMLGAQEV